MIIEDILMICPNLISLQIHLLYSIKNCSFSSHKLENFILSSEKFKFQLDLIDYLFNLMRNIRYLYIPNKMLNLI